MKDRIRCRVLQEAMYIITTHATVRATAPHFGVCKSTVHLDVTDRLREINPQLQSRVQQVLDTNDKEKAVRGGASTARRWRRI